MTRPLVSVVTPVGPRHVDHVRVAAASLAWQTVPPGWVEHVVEFDHDRTGPAATRNRALARAKGVFVVALDADDYLIPSAIETYLRAYAAGGACYVYADNYVISRDGVHYSTSEEYDQRKMARYNQHVVTALYPRALLDEVGGWDERVDIWEDWTAPLRFAIKGWCGRRVPQPALVYRITEGDRMHRGMAEGERLMRPVWELYANEQGAIDMCGCNKPAAAQAALEQASFAVQVLGAPAAQDSGNRLEYTGPHKGSFLVTSPETKQQYRLGGRRIVDADPRDAEWLIALGCAPLARAEFAPPPAPESAAESEAPAGQPEPLPFELTPGPEAPVEGEAFTPKRMRRRVS